MIANLIDRINQNRAQPGSAPSSDLSNAPPVTNPDYFPIGDVSAGTDVLDQGQQGQQQQARDPFQYINSLRGTPYLSAAQNPLLAGSTFGGSISYGLPNFQGFGAVGGGGPYWHLIA
jgi:hypothetical protein